MALIINKEKFNYEELDYVFIPRNIEAKWALITPKKNPKVSILTGVIYYPPNCNREGLYDDHITQTVNIVKDKIKNLRVLIAGDFNELANLQIESEYD